jgi:hypothetical protein
MRGDEGEAQKKGKKKEIQPVSQKSQVPLGFSGDGKKKFMIKLKKELEELREIIRAKV